MSGLATSLRSAHLPPGFEPRNDPILGGDDAHLLGGPVVGEALALPEDQASAGAIQDVRYLRASHSLLGGVYVGSYVYTLDGAPPLRDSFGAPLGDSIYATFNVQEAVRLLDLGTDTPSALVM